MKKTRTANLHHLYHEPLPENLKLTPKVEVDNVHQRQTTDVYEHALTITAWQQIYDQLHPGKFHGEFTEILLDDIQVFREYTGLALRQSCLVWPNSFWFGIPATRGEQGFIGSQCLGSAEIATRPGGTEFELSTPDDYTILGVVLSEDVITRQANFLHNPDRVLHMLRSQSALEVKEQHKAALWGFVQQALATFCENPENLHQPAVRKVVAKYDGKRRRHAVGILASWAICYGLSATVCREAVTDAASADAGVGVRELHPIPDLNKPT